MKNTVGTSSLPALLAAFVFTSVTMFSTVAAAAQQEAQESQVSTPVAEPAEASSDAILSVLDETTPQEPEVPAAGQEAGVAALTPDQINDEFHHRILLDQDGGFTGRVNLIGSNLVDLTGAGNYTVKLFKDGDVLAETTTNANGEFRFSNLRPGVVGLVAYSAQGLTLFGCHLVNADPAEAVAQTALVSISATAITGRDAVTARQMVLAALSSASNGRRFHGALREGEDLFPLGGSKSANSIAYHMVELEPDGTFRGVVNILDERTGRFREVHDMTVHVIRDGRQLAAAAVERDGTFSISGMTPGLAAVVGTGLDGVFGVAVVLNPASADKTALNRVAGPGDFRPAFTLQLNQFGIAPITPGILNRGTEDLVENETPPDFGGGGVGGGAGGGGGFGGGGLAALLAGLGGAIGGYFAGKDDDKPASPGK